jgi:hypothetical protein
MAVIEVAIGPGGMPGRFRVEVIRMQPRYGGNRQ